MQLFVILIKFFILYLRYTRAQMILNFLNRFAGCGQRRQDSRSVGSGGWSLHRQQPGCPSDLLWTRSQVHDLDSKLQHSVVSTESRLINYVMRGIFLIFMNFWIHLANFCYFCGPLPIGLRIFVNSVKFCEYCIHFYTFWSDLSRRVLFSWKFRHVDSNLRGLDPYSVLQNNQFHGFISS